MSDKHVVKLQGEKMVVPRAWCGVPIEVHEWKFSDAQHAILSVDQGRTTRPCYDCMVAIGLVMQRFFNEIDEQPEVNDEN